MGFSSPIRSPCAALILLVVSCAADAPERRPATAPLPAVAIPEAQPGPPVADASAPAPTCDDAAAKDFAAVWPRLRPHLEAGIEGLASLVDPARGVFVLDNPGAFVVPMHLSSLADAGARVPALRREYFRFKCPELRSDATPHFSCETEQWSTEGCVLTADPEFSVARWYELALQYEILPAEDATAGLEGARRADADISHGVYATDAGFGIYFGRVGCEWRVLAIDAVTPCSA